MDEEELVRLVARGDRAAFEELYRRTSPWLAVRLRRRCGDDELVAEVMQDTYLAVWRAAAAFAGAGVGGSAVGWLWTIAARRLVDALRRRARDLRPPPSAALPAAVVPAAEDEVVQATVGDPVGEALRRLAPELRQVLHAMVLDRNVPLAVAAAAGSVAALWSIDWATDHRAAGVLALLAVVAAGAAVIGIVAATGLTGEQLAPAAQVARDAIGMTGLIALGAATLGANHAWVPPLYWTLLSWTVTALPWPWPATYRQVLTWMLQPADATPAIVTALVLGATGVLAYAVLGPRP